MQAMNTWMTSPKFLAQAAHFLGAYAFVLTMSHWHQPLWPAGVAVCAYAGFKEFWYDMKFELPKQSVWDGVLDAAFLVLGMAAGVAVAALT